jgi:hypothetical protein
MFQPHGYSSRGPGSEAERRPGPRRCFAIRSRLDHWGSAGRPGSRLVGDITVHSIVAHCLATRPERAEVWISWALHTAVDSNIARLRQLPEAVVETLDGFLRCCPAGEISFQVPGSRAIQLRDALSAPRGGTRLWINDARGGVSFSLSCAVVSIIRAKVEAIAPGGKSRGLQRRSEFIGWGTKGGMAWWCWGCGWLAVSARGDAWDGDRGRRAGLGRAQQLLRDKISGSNPMWSVLCPIPDSISSTNPR